MKALVYTAPHSVELQVATRPRLTVNDNVLIQVEACGICGSDMHAWHGHDERRPAPLILGHEAVGVVVEGPNAGTRVVVNPLVTCQTCENCQSGRENLCLYRQIISMPPRNGAFAQYLVMPERNLMPVPDHVAPTVAALTEPLACGWHAVRLLGQALIKPLDEARSVVLGGGAIGLGASLALAANEVNEIWLGETNPERRALLKRNGNFRVFDPLGGRGPENAAADIVVDAVGLDSTRARACVYARPGGAIAHIGLGAGNGGLDVRRMTLQEITFLGTYTYTAQDFCDTATAVFDGCLGPLDWPEVRPLEDGAQAFADIDAGRVAAPKIILRP
ncbi:MAG: alcohol dehydrogenase catalytic domain-containing protein [Hyphomicrobiaceae bacterium]